MRPFTLNCDTSGTFWLTLDHYGWQALADAMPDDPLHASLKSYAEPSDVWFDDGMGKRLSASFSAADAFRILDTLKTLDT